MLRSFRRKKKRIKTKTKKELSRISSFNKKKRSDVSVIDVIRNALRFG